jgi:hypothetical protein
MFVDMDSRADTQYSQSSTSCEDLDEKSETREYDPELEVSPEPPTEIARNVAPGGPDPRPFPDGGFEAWFCVAGGFCTLFASLGWINCLMPIFED